MAKLDNLSLVFLRPYRPQRVRWVIDQYKPCLFISLFAHAVDFSLPFVGSVQLVELYLNAKAFGYGVGQREASFRHEKVVSWIAEHSDA